MPVSFLTESGSSIMWAADQILRSDIRPGDIVIWGLTRCCRFPYYDNKVLHILSRYYEYYPEFNNIININRLDEPNMIYRSVTKILQVVNFCKKAGAKLILAGVLVDNDFLPYLIGLDEYLHCSGTSTNLERTSPEFIDYGIDNEHPGPLTHRMYADKILSFIKNV